MPGRGDKSAPDAFQGQRVLVTGASSGIGRATAVAFAAAGATVGICARRADRLEEVLAECNAYTPRAKSWAVDLADLDGIAGFADTVRRDLGEVDVLVNNAGVPKRRTVLEMTPDDVEGVMAINYFAPVRLTAALLPSMIERGTGAVVNVSSMGVHSAAYRVGAYAASKAALELYTEALHLELAGTGVQALLFVPGTTRTEFSTPKPGNDPPFPQDPASTAEPDEVARALLQSIGSPQFVRYATARDEARAREKNADVNAYVGSMWSRFARTRA
ncbi:MAG TPA: SDR family NAD(P)-dependent oxidoreductase [Acidimicrobiales bacterium]|nr:SDR family NAD(P)-dependent oxidoreductase [Acidimicrobiales bacterium]